MTSCQHKAPAAAEESNRTQIYGGFVSGRWAPVCAHLLEPGLLSIVEVGLSKLFFQNPRLPAAPKNLHDEQHDERHEQPIQPQSHDHAQPHHAYANIDRIANS